MRKLWLVTGAVVVMIVLAAVVYAFGRGSNGFPTNPSVVRAISFYPTNVFDWKSGENLTLQGNVESLADGFQEQGFNDTSAIRMTDGYLEMNMSFLQPWTTILLVRNFNANQVLWSKYDLVYGNKIVLDTKWCDYDDTKVCLRVFMDAGNYENVGGGVAGFETDAGVDLNDGQWHEVVVTYYGDGVTSDLVDIWVDMVKRTHDVVLDTGALSFADFVVADSQPLQFGAENGVVSGADFDNIVLMNASVNDADVQAGVWLE